MNQVITVLVIKRVIFGRGAVVLGQILSMIEITPCDQRVVIGFESISLW